MRIISQDGFYDVPYELVAIECVNLQVFARPVVGRESGSICELATYDTREKAIKAMEMLRGRYGKLEVMKVIASGTAEYMEKSLSTNEMIEQHNAYCDMNVFQFPQDDEIEV